MTTSIGSVGHTARKATLTAGVALAVALGALASGALFNACSLRHATRPPDPPPAAIFRYDCTAKVISSDGMLHTITLPRPNLVGAWTCSGPVTDPDNSANVSAVREQMRRYLARALPACTGSGCTDSYGTGSWCVVPDDANDVKVHLENGRDRVAHLANANESGDPLPVCSTVTVAAAICNDPGARLAIAADPDPYGASFGAVDVGGSSPVHTFAVLNVGTGVACLRSAALTAGPGSDWHPIGTDCAANDTERLATGYTMLGAGYRTQCTVSVSFQPTDAGMQSTNLVAESSRMADPAVNLPLTGIGRGLSAAPNPLCFNVSLAMDPVPGRGCFWLNNVVVTNNARNPVRITAASVLEGTLPDGSQAWLDGAYVPGPPPLVLAPGASLTHYVRACRATGLPFGTLRIQSDDAAGDLDVVLQPPDRCP